jgi:ATP-dependent DNA ligase
MSRLLLDQIAPMLACDLRDLPTAQQETIWSDPNYIAEEKFNGVRGLLHIGSSENRISTRCRSKRTGLYSEKTDHFPHLRDLPLDFLEDTVLDGEILMNKSRMFTGETFACGTLACTMALCNASPEKAFVLQQEEGFAGFQVFDILRHKGKGLEVLPFWKRRLLLEMVFDEMAAKGIDLTSLNLATQVSDDKRDFYEAVVSSDGEGLMLKHRDGLYQHTGRSKAMLKAKRFLTVDGFIIGATPGKHGNAGMVGSLLIGAYDLGTDTVREIAGVPPSDLSLGKKSNLRRAMTVLKDGRPCLAPGYLNRVVELEAFCWNGGWRLVHAKILRFRDDKTQRECVIDFLGMED